MPIFCGEIMTKCISCEEPILPTHASIVTVDGREYHRDCKDKCKHDWLPRYVAGVKTRPYWYDDETIGIDVRCTECGEKRTQLCTKTEQLVQRDTRRR